MTTINTKTGTKTLTLPIGSNLKLHFAAAVTAVAVLTIPHIGHAQGIVRGAQEGSREGGRAAGPVGAFVGGAVGAGVGGAVGALNGVLGVPHRYHHRHCGGYYDRHGRFRCYR
jgi:hypothetical protein